jgi:2-polyprenyl-6-hydroxyphenyl methylase/3-demethylubiquinone-9 3-methyltransferase
VESKTKAVRSVNNDIYSMLGSRWYEAEDDPVALLRAEARLRNPWVAGTIADVFEQRRCSVLDVGCGAGFLSNYLAEQGHRVTGLDAAGDSLNVAARHDKTESVEYRLGDAQHLPFESGTFDVVCAMDFLEHVDSPDRVIAEVSRVLTPSGLFFFHTFTRNWLSWLIVIKGVEWFVKNTPHDMHVLRMFLKPEEVTAMCRSHGLGSVELYGARPLFDAAFFKMLLTGAVPEDFGFTFSPSTKLAFTGFARKTADHAEQP